MNFLGIATPGQNVAVALFDKHSIVAAIEEEKLGRATGMGGIPRMAISRCLEQTTQKSPMWSSLLFPAGLPFPLCARLAFGSATCFRLWRPLGARSRPQFSSGRPSPADPPPLWRHVLSVS